MSTPAPSDVATGRARLQQARRDLYRAAILEAAEAEFAAAGYDAARVQTIARRAGVSLATFYAAFPGKWEVLRAVQEDRLGALMQRVGTLVMQARTPIERLQRGLDGYLRFHIEHPRFLAMQLRDQVPWGTTDELRTPEQTRAWQAGLQLLEATFRECMAAGLLVEDDPELCARTATAMSQVRLVRWLATGMKDDADTVARAAMQQFVRTFARPQRHAELLAST
ncbi:MAG: TetR/AcrR family transcriptional regulator [Nannocystaceae bacterium]|nr:TetR/AcrR family transcriptional regulator [Nannocystaceae bacterium]